MKISILGAGRVGRTLGRLAADAGHRIGDVVCFSPRSSREAVSFIGRGIPLSARDPLGSKVDLVLVATPDDSIEAALASVRENAAAIGNPVLLHTSGSISSADLEHLVPESMSLGSCHPLFAFQSPARNLKTARRLNFCIDGDPRSTRLARALVRSLGGHEFRVSAGSKPLYHAAAVLAAGGTVSLLSIGIELLQRCGLSEAQANRVLTELAESAIANLKAVGAPKALTGPVRRGDSKTIERNLKSLFEVDPVWMELYVALGHRALDLARRAGLGANEIRRVKKSLDQHRGRALKRRSRAD